MGKVVVFKKPIVLRCHSCNKIKPEIKEEFSHRGIDYSDNTQPHSWIVYQSGWKRVEVLPLKNGKNSEGRVEKVYFHCPDCRSLGWLMDDKGFTIHHRRYMIQDAWSKTHAAEFLHCR